MDDGRVRAILFDLDGVLVDSLDTWTGVVNDVRVALGLTALTEAEVAALFGQGVEDDVKNIYRGHSVEEIRGRYDAAMPRHLHRMRVGSGTEAVLARLGERGLGRAVVTNTQGSLAREVLRTTGLEAHVDVLVAAGEGCREKPHPDLLQRALARLGRAPEEARMVGDTDYDEAAARAAGVAFLRFDVRAGGRLAERLAPWVL